MVQRLRGEEGQEFDLRNARLMYDDDPDLAIREIKGRVIQSKLHPVLSRSTKTSRLQTTLPDTPSHITKSVDGRYLAHREHTFNDFKTAADLSAAGDTSQTPVANNVSFVGMGSSSLTQFGLCNTSSTPNTSVISRSGKTKKTSKLARLFCDVRHFFRPNRRHEREGWMSL
ncbi:uncharacterized protein LOC124121324 [Haliotis rufescens]|uniref:uncharacterized protein LOC124121324 n=1 Tax=Haliotis rufescens TaxID=6454 RepID=UPI00201F3ED5|nr:uncharacterized protein LOC124121324 [Haliotis rufescens]